MSQTPPEEENPPVESQSILTSTKAALGVPETHTAFDAEILMHINSALSELHQVGIGPEDGLYVDSKSVEWVALIGTNPNLLMAKTYVQQYTKLLYDPPEVGFVVTSMERTLERLIWRLMVEVDKPKPKEDAENEQGQPVLVLDGGEL